MAGKGTPFEGMSHEQMLAWLDQANSGEVQSAADKLVNAAKEIRKIADELKIRPQWVEWKGEGADAFRIWAGDLANSAYRLADFSDGSAKWLGEASKAISTAKASIPRDKASATANLEAARKYHNDPDSQEIASKSRAELAAIEANKEKVRLEAVAEMRKLAQAYDQSSEQLDKLERPKFPPPPSEVSGIETPTEISRPGTSDGGGAVRNGTSTGTVSSRESGGPTGEPGAIRGAFGRSGPGDPYSGGYSAAGSGGGPSDSGQHRLGHYGSAGDPATHPDSGTDYPDRSEPPRCGPAGPSGRPPTSSRRLRAETVLCLQPPVEAEGRFRAVGRSVPPRARPGPVTVAPVPAWASSRTGRPPVLRPEGRFRARAEAATYPQRPVRPGGPRPRA
ncbi:hypothetical protein GCM10020256_26700 [Streptomyces thermocoprophilus]